MRLSLTRYLMAVLCMLAAGTWILPVHTLAAPAPAPAAPIDDGDEIVSLLTLRDAIEAMRLAGEFDRAPFAFNGADLTGDGVAETIEVFPPQRLETPGFMRVIDGATGADRYTLRAPAGEMGFGEHCAVVSDCDEGGILDIGVLSWLDASGDPSSALMELRMRVFSGASGELVGVLHTVREVGSALSPTDLSVVVAGDANHDEVLDLLDVVEASSALASDAVSTPSIDCRADGALTIEDLGSVVRRVLEEPMAQRAGLYSSALRNPGVVALIARPGSGVSPSQMGGGAAGGAQACEVKLQTTLQCLLQAGRLAYDALRLVRSMLACTGPHAPFCVVPILCQMRTVFNQIFLFVDQCMTNRQCIPDWLVGLSAVLAFAGAICNGELSRLTESQRREFVEWMRKLGRLIA